MVATSRIENQTLRPNGVLTHFSDGSVELRPYRTVTNGEGTVDGLTEYVDMFPPENDIPDMLKMNASAAEWFWTKT